MEKSVNAWLEENPSVEIQQVRQSESMNQESWSLTLPLFYTGDDWAKIGFETKEGKEA